MYWRIGVVWIFLAVALAQFNPGPAEYYGQCRALYQQQVLSGARAACELALVADPDYIPALKQIIRIDLEEGKLDEAGEKLDHLLRLQPEDMVSRVLHARYLLETGKYAQALELCRNTPGEEADWIRARALELLGRPKEALDAYREAELLGDKNSRVWAARLLQRLHRPEEALQELGDLQTPKALALKGRLLLAAGKLPQAAEYLEGALANIPGDSAEYTEALTALALAYYGMGDFAKGGRVLSQLESRINLSAALLSSSWLWLLGLVLLIGLHLYGESRIEPISTLEVRSEREWGVGRLYVILLASWLGAALLAALSGILLYGNLLAAFTPVQADVVRPIFYVALALANALAAFIALRNPPEDAPSPLGKKESWIEGLWIGVIIAVLFVAYALLRQRLGWLDNLPFNPLLWPGAVALASFALAEPLLRSVLLRAFQTRYGRHLAPLFTVLSGGMFLLTPLLLWWSLAAFLLLLRRRLASLWPNMAAWPVAALLLLAVGMLPVVRALFR